MFKFYQTIVILILWSVFLLTSCDFIAARSNLMSERYEFDVTQDSLIKKITAYNNMTLQDSLFKISQGDRPVNEISRFLGYNNPAHFSASFKKHFGVKPKAIQRSSNLVGGHN